MSRGSSILGGAVALALAGAVGWHFGAASADAAWADRVERIEARNAHLKARNEVLAAEEQAGIDAGRAQEPVADAAADAAEGADRAVMPAESMQRIGRR